MPLDYNAIPEELRWDKQWLIAGPDDEGNNKAPKFIARGKMYDASIYNPAHFYDLESAIEDAIFPLGLGYVLTSADEYTVIDLDIKNQYNYPNNPELWTSEENIQRYYLIIQTFNSYTERSASGQGFHIWVKGSIGPGIKRDGVEVYSRDRFIVTTGNVVINEPIKEAQELLNILVEEIKNGQESAEGFELVEIEPDADDLTILERAQSAENGQRYLELFNATSCVVKNGEKIHGSYTELGYPTQSEADMALMSIFTFYSKSNEQCKRLFRMSGLGKRTKNLYKDYHLNRILTVIRARQAGEQVAQQHGESLAVKLLANVEAEKLPDPILFDMNNNPLPEKEFANQIEWPPGLAGQIAHYIFLNSPRPVKEISITAALGLLAGIAGRCFNIPQSGLNMYLILVARSAIGKEALHTGISNVISMLANAGNAFNYVDFTDYASGPGLIKAVSSNSSFVNVSGEFGRKLRRLAMEDGKEGPMSSLRTIMTHLYQKSGHKNIVGGIGYSNKENNVASISGVAYSMVGETTPSTFYESLTTTMMEDGFLSRFTVIEYNGDRPPLNEIRVVDMSVGTRGYFQGLVDKANKLNSEDTCMMVRRSPDAAKLLDDYNLSCDDEVKKAGDDEGWRQMWNRAHLKAYRLAAVLAVADNYEDPMIHIQHATWAIDLIMRDIKIMKHRMSSGDVGIGDAQREQKLLSIIGKYLQAESISASYGVPEKMRKSAVVPRKYLQVNIQRNSNFTTHRLGVSVALDHTIRTLIDNGYIMEVIKEKAIVDYEFHGKCYRVVSLPKEYYSV